MCSLGLVARHTATAVGSASQETGSEFLEQCEKCGHCSMSFGGGLLAGGAHVQFLLFRAFSVLQFCFRLVALLLAWLGQVRVIPRITCHNLQQRAECRCRNETKMLRSAVQSEKPISPSPHLTPNLEKKNERTKNDEIGQKSIDNSFFLFFQET